MEVQLSPLHDMGSIPVTKFEDPRMAFPYVAKRIQTTVTGKRPARKETLSGAMPPNTGIVRIGV